MNYFEMFGLPVSFQVDFNTLTRKFTELQQKSHGQPGDNISVDANVGPSDAQLEKGYKILQDQDKTIPYLLRLKGLLEEDEQFEPDPQFRLEVMDIDEELMELGLDENQEQLMNVEQKANRLMLKLYEDIAPVVENYREDFTTEEELLQVKDFYFRKKYLQGILDKIKGIRNIASPL